MDKRYFIYNIVLSILGLFIGLLFIIADPEQFLKFVFIAIGIYIILTMIPLIFSLHLLGQGKERTIIFIYCLIQIAVALLLIIYPHTIAYYIAGAFLIVLPIIRIIFDKNHFETFKKEIVRLILGTILIVGGIGVTVQIILYIIGGLIMLCSLLYIVYTIILWSKVNKQEKINREQNDVIDV